MVNFSDLGISTTLDGEKKKLDEILNIKIVITGYKVKDSKYSKKNSEFYTTIQFYFENDEAKKPYVIFTGSSILKEQLDSAFEKLKELNEESFATTITKVGNYYSMK